MNALAQLPQPSPQPDQISTAVGLADEGIPVFAIARAMHIPSDEVYELLRDAIAAGTITEMPKDDWPPGSTRSQRSMLSNTALDNEETLQLACSRFFRVTKQEAGVVAMLLRRKEATKEQLHLVVDQQRPGNHRGATDQKIVDVLICKIRKKMIAATPPGEEPLRIETLWSVGYLINRETRTRIVTLLTNFLAEN